jgi:subtilisin family serine protease
MVAPGGENISGITLDEFVLQDLIIGACSEFVAGCEGGDFFAWADGTSAAAPHVTGAAAVVESNLPGDQTPDQLAACIQQYADNVGAAVFFGSGRLNVLAAAKCS